MKALVITVAGCSSRFSKSIGRSVLKAVYHEGSPERGLLWRMLSLGSSYFEKIVVVGGFQFDYLTKYLSLLPTSLTENVSLVNNAHYADRGSGWSLYEGLRVIQHDPLDSILFAEGDLFVDRESFGLLCEGCDDALTYTNHLIDASTSVVYYEDVEHHPHYLYDTAHNALMVPEPFLRIFNSGQIWRFGDPKRLFDLMADMPLEELSGTNLELVNNYFQERSLDEVQMVEFKEWINCNTIDDYRQAFVAKEHA